MNDEDYKIHKIKRCFLNFKLSLLAKEKGFAKEIPEEFISFYSMEDKDFDGPGSLAYGVSTDEILIAPMYEQILDWFRENHKLEISSLLTAENKRFPFIEKIPKNGFDFEVNNDYLGKGITYDSYYEALDKALIEAFKLI